MLFFKKNKKERFDYRLIGADMHSHLLPGIDDGSPHITTSVELVKGLHDLGYTTLITTPHIMRDMYPNTPEIIAARLKELQSSLEQSGIPVTIQAAAEYFLDEYVEDLLKQKEPLLTIKDNWVLCEFSLAFASRGLKDILFEMQMQGYQPVIAHPERYIYLQQEKSFFDELKDTGCYFQLNIGALCGYYGKSVQDLAEYLIKKGYYDLVGTDLHNIRHLEMLEDAALTTPLQQLLDTGRIRNGELAAPGV